MRSKVAQLKIMKKFHKFVNYFIINGKQEQICNLKYYLIIESDLHFNFLFNFEPKLMMLEILKSNQFFLGRFRRNIPIAVTLMVRLPENVIIVSPIMAPRPQNHPPFKSL